jgi:hypothetical protein
MNIQDMTSKQISDKLAEHGIKMHFNSKREKLEEALNNLNINEDNNMEAVIQTETPTNTDVTAITDDMLTDFKINGVELEGLREKDALKLIRVIVRPNDPLKLESSGEIFSFGSKLIDAKKSKKYIPFNNEEGWHITNMMLENIQAAECQIFKKVTRNGQDTMESQKIKAYNIQVLPALNKDEIEKIAIRQKATSSVG